MWACCRRGKRLGKLLVLVVATSLVLDLLVMRNLTAPLVMTNKEECFQILDGKAEQQGPLLVSNRSEGHAVTSRRKYVIPEMPIGPGENGTGVELQASAIRDPATRRRYEKLEEQHGYNALVADTLSLHRSLPLTLADPACALLEYPEERQLPSASVVLPYRDELVPTLLRSVHSVLDRSPPSLIADIVLVDDGSTDEVDKDAIDRYVALLPKVKVVRWPKSRGLMVARTEGARAASGDVVIIMDSHIEVTSGWLEPLLWRLVEKPRHLLFPSMDAIDGKTLRYHSVGRQTFLQAWDDALDQYLVDVHPHYLASLPSTTSPILAPAIQGWALAMRRDVFLRLGGFDPGMELWGSEQYEISFKVWMCGGAVELVPCSRVGHVYRNKVVWSATSRDPALGGTQRYNTYRVADVWMDDYGAIVKEANGNYTYASLNTTAQKELRQKLGCGSFQSYLDQIRNLTFMYLPEKLQARGTITEVGTGRCLEAPLREEGEAKLRPCRFQGKEEFWEWSKDGEVRHFLTCLTVGEAGRVQVKKCDHKQPVRWTYTQDSLLRHEGTSKCLKSSNGTLVVENCTSNDSFRWYWRRLPSKGS